MVKNFDTSIVYNTIASDYNDCFNAISPHLDDFLNLVQPKGKILDVGCGPGVDSQYMSLKGFDVIGIDNAEQMLALARQKKSNAKFVLHDMITWNRESSSFDAILASYSLVHIPKNKIQRVLKKFNRMLKKKGILSINIHEGESEEISIPEPFAPNLMTDLNIMSIAEIKHLLEFNGFSIINCFLEKALNDKDFEDYNKLCIIAIKN